MRILLVHNRYLMPGGEDQIFESETSLLRQYGHEVRTWVRDNHELVDEPRLATVVNTIWSRASQQHLKQMLHEQRPDVVHFHNTFLSISPAAYYTCQEANIPVVQTLHNYRLICPAATLYRDGQICEDCLGKWGLWPSIHHGCWHDSSAQTAVVATMLMTHRWLKTWQKQVNIFIVLTEFARQKFIHGGLPPEKLVVKPNFISTPPQENRQDQREPFALFVGRLSAEKGPDLLLQAWKQLPHLPLKIVGDGPMMPILQQMVQQHGLTQVEFCGRVEQEEVLRLMQKASLLVVSSTWYEGLPTAILEAFSRHLPVIAPQLGSMGEIIRHKENGIHFKAHDAEDLARWVQWSWEHPEEMKILAENAYRESQERYSVPQNYLWLMEIYQRAMSMSNS